MHCHDLDCQVAVGVLVMVRIEKSLLLEVLSDSSGEFKGQRVSRSWPSDRDLKRSMMAGDWQ
jgi:hypothetical protein